MTCLKQEGSIALMVSRLKALMKDQAGFCSLMLLLAIYLGMQHSFDDMVSRLKALMKDQAGFCSLMLLLAIYSLNDKGLTAAYVYTETRNDKEKLERVKGTLQSRFKVLYADKPERYIISEQTWSGAIIAVLALCAYLNCVLR